MAAEEGPWEPEFPFKDKQQSLFMSERDLPEPFPSPVMSDDYKLPKVLNSAGNIHGNHQQI